MKFEVTAPDGRTLEIEGDSYPSESELDEIFSSVKPDIDYNKAKASDIFSTDGLPSDTPSKLQGLGKFLKEGVGKPVVQGYFNIGKGIGGIMNWYADQARVSEEDADALGISEGTRNKLNTFSDILNIAGDSIRFGSEDILKKEWLKSNPEIFKGGFFENPSWTRTSAAVASALPSLGSIVALGEKGFAMGYALMAGSENADIYLEAKEKIGKDKASGLFLAGTAGTAIIDIAMKPVEKIIKPLKGNFIKRMGERAIRGGMEALPESMQQVWQNAVKKYGYDDTQALAEGVIESAIGGFGIGAIASGSGKLLEQGATEEEVEQLQNIISQSVIENSEELNDIAYQDMKKTLTKINEKFANMPEDQRMRISRELEEGFGNYYKELSNIMPEEQALSNAAIIRNQAFFMSDLMGISPKEYFEKYAPNIEKMNFADFVNKTKPEALQESNLKVNDEVIDVHGDEYYKKMTLSLGDEQLGYIDYSVVDGKPYIQMINVSENQRRKGYATELVKRLQNEYSDQEIDFGMMTDEGTKLYESLPKNIEVNPEYDEMQKKLEESDKKLKEYGDILDKVTGDETGEEQKKIIEVADAWQEEHNRNEEYKDWLENNKRETVYIDTKGLQTKEYQSFQESLDLTNSLKEINKAEKTKTTQDTTKALNSNKGHIEFNMVSLKDKTSIDYMKEVAKKTGMKEKDFNALYDKVFEVADSVNEKLKENPNWQEWNAKQIKTFADANGLPLPVRSIFVTNGDYDFNIDLGTLCVKREFADKVIRYLVARGYGSQLGLVKLEQLKALLRKYEIAVACDICFVEGKRLNSRMMSNALAYEWESVRKALGITDTEQVGTLRQFTEEQAQILNLMTDRRFIKDDGSIMSEEEYESLPKAEKDKFKKSHKMVFQKAYDDYMPEERKRAYVDKEGKDAYDKGITADKMYSIAKLFKQDSRLAGVMDPDIFMNSEQTTELREEYYNTEMPSFLNSYAGAGTPKPLYGFNPYYELSWRDVYDRNPDKFLQMLYEIGGVRGQSFSDYNELLFIDYLQKYMAETIRAVPAHEYTKQASLVRTFGDIGVMYNMSLVPKIEKGIDAKHYGLRKATEEEIKAGKSKEGFMLRSDDDGTWTYSFHKDSFPVKDAFELREKFDKTSGIIVVGVSDMQIEMMLDDPTIDMVIPFHASGMPAHTKLLSGLVNVDYTSTQTTKNLKGAKDFSFNAEMQKIKDARKTADSYLEWCKKNGYREKFPQFSKNKNYYKLLEDFRSYDKDGNPIIQGAVNISKADWSRITEEAVKGAEERTKTLEGGNDVLVSEQFMKELESIFNTKGEFGSRAFQQVDTMTQDLMKKRLVSTLGKDNALFLQQEDFLSKLKELQGETFRNNIDGTVYGFAHNGKVYINENTFNAHTPVHEFTHIWAKIAQQVNPNLWKKGKKLLQQTDMWEKVKEDKLYQNIKGDEDAVAREVLARLSGYESEQMIKQMLDYTTKGHAQEGKLIEKIMKFIKDVFNTALNVFNPKAKINFTLDEFVKMPMVDFFDESRHKAFRDAKKKANLDGYEGTELTQYQGEQNPQGAYADDVIYLFENANASTLPHELSHRWKKELQSILAETGNERVKGMLDQVNTWEESEFKRKYNAVKRENGYAIVNKKGDVVYDNRGSGFLTEQDAIDYAKNELFARGFEQYLREGKAPNNSMKQAFRNFFMWLKRIYRDAMDLNIQLSPDIKNVYADILGGTDIDFFLNATPEEFVQQRAVAEQEKGVVLDGMIKDAIANKKQTTKNNGGKGFSEIWSKAMIPLSTRAKRISPKLRNVLRKYEFTLTNELNKKYAKITPFMEIWKGMSEDDAIAFDIALKNDYVSKQLEIVDKYNARKEWESVKETLENIFDEAINVGLDIDYRHDYFPRRVKDVDGLLSYIHNVPEWSSFQQALNEAGLSGATAEEQAEFINKFIRGLVKSDIMPNKFGNEKERRIDLVTNEMNQFYAPSMEALVSYIEGLNSRIASAKFLGKGENIEESIGGYLTYLLNNNIIAPNQMDEVRAILKARFDARGVSNKWLANARNYSYMYTMGGINSAITQIEDLSVAMYKAGVWNSLTTAMDSKRITKKDLGLESIAAEFVDQSKSGMLLNKLFKITGLDAIDSFGKETLVNAELKKFQEMDTQTLREYLQPIMEEETESTIKDIKNDVISDNVLYLMFSELSDVQPISLSELPEFYNRAGNLRVLYMLKSFAVKRIDTFRNECIDKIKSKDFNVRKEGMQNLFKLATLMILCGSTKDWLIDLLYGRNTDISETLLNNILGLAGISKFQIYQAKEKGFTGTVKDIIAPPLYSFFDDLFTDVVKIGQGKRKIKDMEVLKGIPLVGRFYYWWVGRGREKSKGKKKSY